MTYQYFCDANGNVGQVVNASDGSVAAHYEYDPFGNMVSQTGDYADGNPYRFSTKYRDAETSLYYYGYRYYSSSLGRWISRDPIEEEGGYSLYVIVSNDVLNRFDPTGLYDFVASGTESFLINTGKESRYLQSKGEEYLNNDDAGEHGSRASFGGYFATLGLVSAWDAVREGKAIAEEIVDRDDEHDRGLGHSQGVRICLQGIYQAAKKCKELAEKGEGCCRKEKMIRLILAAPKTSARYIDKIHRKVKDL